MPTRRTKITVGTGITSHVVEMISFHDQDELLTLEQLEEEREVWRSIARRHRGERYGEARYCPARHRESLNHSSGSFGGIVGVYQHHDFADEKRTALNAWADHIARILNGSPTKVVKFQRRAG